MSKKIEFRRYSKCLTACAADVTASRLASAFQVNVDSLYIKEEWGELALWPTEAGRFNFTQVQDNSSFEVMGETQSTNPSQGNLFSYTPSPTPVASSTVAKKQFTKKVASSSTFACKVIIADMHKNGKSTTFEEQGQTYINVNQDSANVNYITEQLKEKTGKNLMVVAGNGLPITDEEATRGTKFWKCPSRRIYATPVTKRGKKRSTIESASSDSELETSSMHAKKRRTSVTAQLSSIADEIRTIQEDLQTVSTSIEEVKQFNEEIKSISNSLSVPLSVVKLVGDGFKCKVCLKQPMTPPIIAAKCCNSLIGCTSCINQWYGGDDGLDKAFPHCREPRGYANTCQFKGLDEFLNGMKGIFHQENDQD